MANEPAGSEPATVTFTQAQLDDAVSRATATSVSRSDASAIAKACVDGGVPTMTASLLAEGVSLAEAKTRIGAAGEVKNLVALARRKDPNIPEDLADTMLAEGKTVEQARAALFDKLVAAENETSISSHIPADGKKTGDGKPVDLVADMKRRHGVKD